VEPFPGLTMDGPGHLGHETRPDEFAAHAGTP
jgi:hypothetical protein